ncbi:MAG: PHP domain-containing protein [Ruminococcaceae bacterium]|nr:PHP domain-containing protein [Oscillospiraceae bacterium]
MIYPLLPTEGNLYKVNLHCHTNISDGVMSPEEVKEKYKALGYHAVCYTDHEVLIPHKELCDEEFIALHGYEVAIKQDLNRHTAFFMPVYHLNLIAEDQDNVCMPRFFKNNPSMPGHAREWAEKHGIYDENDIIDTVRYDTEWLSDYIEAVSKSGFLVTYNHPQWSLQTATDYLGLRGLHAIEAINGGCRFLNDNTSLHYEQMLRAGMKVVPNGGDDNHRACDIGHAWTMIKAPELSYKALIDAYKRGDCYATDGPSFLELYIEDGEIVIKSSPVVAITLLSEGRCCSCKVSDDGTLTEARFPYQPDRYGSFFRFELRDGEGHHAYSVAYRPESILL